MHDARTYSPESIERLRHELSQRPQRAPDGSVAISNACRSFGMKSPALLTLIEQLSLRTNEYVGSNNKINRYLSAEDYSQLRAYLAQDAVPYARTTYTSRSAASLLLNTSTIVFDRIAKEQGCTLARMRSPRSGKIGDYLSPEQLEQIRAVFGR